MTQRWAAVAALAVTLSLFSGGCAKQTDLLNSLLIQPQTADELGYGIQWQTALGLERGESLIYVESLGDRLVTLDTANVLTVFDAANGSRMWSEQLGKGNTERFSKPLRRGNELIISSETRTYLYDLQFGDPLGAVPISFTSNTTPVIDGEQLIHGSPSGRVWSQDTEFGVYRWQYGGGSAITNNPIKVGDVVLLTTAAGEVHAISAESGLSYWTAATYTQISGKPATDGRILYVPSEDQSVYAYYITSGRQAWRHYNDDPIRGDLTLVGNILLVEEPGSMVTALDPNNGDVIWENAELASMQKVLLSNSKGVYIKMPYSIAIINPRTGRIIQSIETPAVHDVTVGSVVGGRPDLYLVRANGRIMKLSAR